MFAAHLRDLQPASPSSLEAEIGPAMSEADALRTVARLNYIQAEMLQGAVPSEGSLAARSAFTAAVSLTPLPGEPGTVRRDGTLSDASAAIAAARAAREAEAVEALKVADLTALPGYDDVMNVVMGDVDVEGLDDFLAAAPPPVPVDNDMSDVSEGGIDEATLADLLNDFDDEDMARIYADK